MSGCRPHCNPRGSCRRPVPNPNQWGCWDSRVGQHPGQKEHLLPGPGLRRATPYEGMAWPQGPALLC